MAHDHMNQRGFVLSFATFVLALFILVYAQIQSAQLAGLEGGAFEVHQLGYPLRVARGVSIDLNALIDQHPVIDQNETIATLRLNGWLKSPLNLQPNLLRYQNNLLTFGRDGNVSAFVDLNFTMNDQNLWGRTNTGLRWYQPLDTNSLVLYHDTPLAAPRRIDMNITADQNGILTFTQGAGTEDSEDYYFYFTYSDTNSSNTQIVSGWLDADITYTFDFAYAGGQTNTVYVNTLGTGLDANTLALARNSSANWRFNLTWEMENDTNGTLAGYDLNLLIQGRDANVQTNTIWVSG